MLVCVTRAHKHRHVTTPKGAKRLLKMACNKVCMTARGKMVRLSVNVSGVCPGRKAFLPGHTPLTLTLNLTILPRAVIQTLLHAIFNSRFAPFGVVT